MTYEEKVRKKAKTRKKKLFRKLLMREKEAFFFRVIMHKNHHRPFEFAYFYGKFFLSF